MGQPYVGEIRMFAGNFPPAGWMFCEGQLLPISENETLFNLIGTTYGGDGQNTFGLPDLRGRVPMHQGGGFTLAETGGAEEVTISVNTMASHTHPFLASTKTGTSSNPGGNVLDQNSGTISMYIDGQAPDGPMAAGMISSIGGSQPHTNFQPYLCVDFIISLFGIFPSQT
jgi:microcystin-dependent protein